MADANHNCWDIVEKSQILSDTYSKTEFTERIEGLTNEEFNKFCKQVLLLTHYYHSTHGASVCDIKPFIDEHPEKFWSLPQIDFDQSINFRRVD